MNFLIYDSVDCDSSGVVTISDSRVNHITTTLKCGVGDSLKVGLLNGQIGTATILSLDEKKGTVVFAPKLCIEPPASLPLTLVVAMSRPKSMRKVFRYATAMGVKKFIIIKSWRVDKSYWQTPLLEEENLSAELLLALEQCGDTVMPTVECYKQFKPFVEDTLPEISCGTERLLAHPYNAVNAPYALNCPTTLVVGPEGGFIPYEVEMIERAGFTSVSLGSRILRVENAVAALTARLFV